MIHDGRSLSQDLFGEALDPRSYLLRFYAELANVVPSIDHVVLTAAPLVARVNHGVWKASCECGARGVPTPGCVVFLAAPLGFCIRCGNGGTGRGWRPILVPDAFTVTAIEAVLMCRPNVEDRNWESSETVADLIEDNLAHSCDVPRGF